MRPRASLSVCYTNTEQVNAALTPLQARYLRAILTSHAQCGQLGAALALVKRAKEEELQVGMLCDSGRLFG